MRVCLAVDFTNQDYLAKFVPPSRTDNTLFIVLSSDSNSPNQAESFFSSYHNDSSGKNQYEAIQIHYSSPDNSFSASYQNTAGIFSDSVYGPFESQQSKLYSLRSTQNLLETFADGNKTGDVAIDNYIYFDSYTINQNRNGYRKHDSKIAEVILFNRALSDCEIQDVNKYLGDKYGRDFSGGFEATYDVGQTVKTDIASIGKFGIGCAGHEKQIDSDSSAELSISVDSGDNSVENNYVAFAHNNEAGNNFTPSALNSNVEQLARIWRVQETVNTAGNPALGDKPLSFTFDLSNMGLSNLDKTKFGLFVDADGDFNDASLLFTGSADYTLDIANSTVTFTNKTLDAPAELDLSESNDVFVTLAVMKPDAGQVNVNGCVYQQYFDDNLPLYNSHAYWSVNNTIAINGLHVARTDETSLANPAHLITQDASGSGKFLFHYSRNNTGRPTSIASSVMFEETLTPTVQANKTYRLSFKLANINETNPAKIRPFINNVALSNAVRTQGQTWKQFDFIWQSGSSTTANIKLINETLTADGNNFAIDEIELCPVSDFGDAPDTYKTLKASDGAEHKQPLTGSNPHLGTVWNGELEAVVAAGDASDDTSDDGVFLGDASDNANLLQGKELIAQQSQTINVKIVGSGKLSAWIDWSGNGEFENSEKVATDLVDDNNDNIISITLTPPSSLVAGTSIARFRYSSDSGLNAYGTASDGEVEDYQVQVLNQVDFGDAPATYGDPSHIIVNANQLFLGTIEPDLDPSSQPSDNANGDNSDTNNDEDGISVLTPLKTSHTTYTVEVKAKNITGSTAQLVGWIDFDRNGTFDSDEATTLAIPDATDGTVNLTWSTISNDMSDGITYLRLRLTTDATIATGDATTSLSTGLASDGEVEDYSILITLPSNNGTSLPFGNNAGLQLWLDASDTDGDGDLTNNPANETVITTWVDKSGSGNDAVVVAGQTGAKFINTSDQTINGQPVLRFDRTDMTNGSLYRSPLDIRASNLEDITVFTVYKSKSNDNLQAPWGNDNQGWDRIFVSRYQDENGAIGIGDAYHPINKSGEAGKLYLQTTVYDGDVSGNVNLGPANQSAIYFDGQLITKFTDQTHPTDANSTLGIGWDGDNVAFDGYIAEMIVFDRAMSRCEIEQVNNYLGTKYGRDFNSFSNQYSFGSSSHKTEINALGLTVSSNCALAEIRMDEAVSAELTISNPSSNDTFNEYLSVAHNDLSGISLETPAGANRRFKRSWKVDEDGDLGTVKAVFDISQTDLNNYPASTFMILVDPNKDGDFSDATIKATGGTYADGKVTFDGIDFTHSEEFTIGALIAIDFGDAPNSYGSVSHLILNASDIYLGTNIPDLDLGYQPSVEANADDTDVSTNDEDGITTLPELRASHTNYAVDVKVTNTLTETAYLVGWLDVDISGTFDADEAVALTVAPDSSGMVKLSWDRLPDDVKGGKTYLRIRLTTDPAISSGDAKTSSPIGLALDGEVEDYTLTIESSTQNISGYVYDDTNINGTHDTGEKGIKDVLVVLMGVDDKGQNVCIGTLTKISGAYTFKLIKPGTYTIYQTNTSGVCDVANAAPVTGYMATSVMKYEGQSLTNAPLTGLNFGQIVDLGGGSGSTGSSSAFIADQNSVIYTGETGEYTHIFTAPASGQVSFVSNLVGNNWGYLIRRDSNCDGFLSSTEQSVAFDSSPINVAAKDKICLVAKVTAPSSAADGEQSTLTIDATFQYSGVLSSQTRTSRVTDISIAKIKTTGGGTGAGASPELQLIQQVRNVSRGSQFSDAIGQVSPGEVLEYRIQYSNPSAKDMDYLVINDMVPEYTELVANSLTCQVPASSGMSCATSVVSDAIEWAFTGVLKSGMQGSVSFQVTVE